MTVNIARPCVAAVLVACAVSLPVYVAGCNSCSEKPDQQATAEAALDDEAGVAVGLKLDDDDKARAIKLLSKMSKGRFPRRVARRKDHGKYFLYLAAKSQNPEVVVAALEAMKVAYAPTASPRSERPAANRDYSLVVAAYL